MCSHHEPMAAWICWRLLVIEQPAEKAGARVNHRARDDRSARMHGRPDLCTVSTPARRILSWPVMIRTPGRKSDARAVVASRFELGVRKYPETRSRMGWRTANRPGKRRLERSNRLSSFTTVGVKRCGASRRSRVRALPLSNAHTGAWAPKYFQSSRQTPVYFLFRLASRSIV